MSYIARVNPRPDDLTLSARPDLWDVVYRGPGRSVTLCSCIFKSPPAIVVTAVTSAGASGFSELMLGETRNDGTAAEPLMPRIVPGSVTGGEASVEWTVPCDTGGSTTAMWYTLWIGDEYTTGVRVVWQGAETSARIGYLLATTSYTLSLTVDNDINAQGTADVTAFAIDFKTTPPTAPSAPMGIVVLFATGGALVISFDAPDYLGGASLDYFYVYLDGARIAKIDAAPSVTYTIRGLTPRSGYNVTAVAVNAAGLTSRNSDPLTAVTTAMTPAAAPEDLSFTSTGGTVTLRWSRPLDTGGADIDEYVLTRSQKGADVPVGSTPDDAGELSFTANDLKPSTSYVFLVTPVTAAGGGVSGTIVGRTTEETSASAPIDGVAAIVNHNSLVVRWAPPFDDGGAPAVITYTIALVDSDNSSFAMTVTVPGTERLATFDALLFGHAYNISMFATTDIGDGAVSPVLRTVLGPATSAPVLVAVAAYSATSVDLRWTEPHLHAGPAGYAGYTLERLDVAHSTWITGGSTAGDAREGRVAGLAAGTTYSLRVRAILPNGTFGAPSGARCCFCVWSHALLQNTRGIDVK